MCRDEEAGLGGAIGATDGDGGVQHGLIRMDMTAHLDHKVAALAAHGMQFAIGPELLPLAQVWRLLGQECFEPVPLATSTGIQYARGAANTIRLDDQPSLALRA